MDQFSEELKNESGSSNWESHPSSSSDKGSREEAHELNDRMLIDDVWDPLWDEDLFLIQLRDKLRTVPAYGSTVSEGDELHFAKLSKLGNCYSVAVSEADDGLDPGQRETLMKKRKDLILPLLLKFQAEAQVRVDQANLCF
jgi:hypothetical protein